MDCRLEHPHNASEHQGTQPPAAPQGSPALATPPAPPTGKGKAPASSFQDAPGGLGGGSGGGSSGVDGSGSVPPSGKAPAPLGSAASAGPQGPVKGPGVGGGALSGPSSNSWKPTMERGNPSRECIKRVRHDIRTLTRDPLPGVFVVRDENLVTVVHALITGPFDTPYEGGFFYFTLRCPDDYPHSPPKVRLMTTGGGTVRYNPNLYKNGKVCLSILGTWNGPGWTPVHSISSVLVSIQSLMNDKPYHNEPGYEVALDPRDVRNYSDCIQHETLRVAVCSTARKDSSLSRSLPEVFRKLVGELFLSFTDHYELVCTQNLHRDGQRLTDPFGDNRGHFQYGNILRTIRELRDSLRAESEALAGADQGTPDAAANAAPTGAAAAAAAAAAAVGNSNGKLEGGGGGSGEAASAPGPAGPSVGVPGAGPEMGGT